MEEGEEGLIFVLEKCGLGGVELATPHNSQLTPPGTIGSAVLKERIKSAVSREEAHDLRTLCTVRRRNDT